RGEAAAVGAEGQVFDPVVVPAAGELFLAGLRVPQLYQPGTGSGEPPAVGAELDALHAVGKTTQRERLLPGVQVPDLDFPFFICRPAACGGQALTVRAKGHGPHPDPAGVFEAKMGRVDLALKDLLHIPKLDRPIPASRGEVPTVR